MKEGDCPLSTIQCPYSIFDCKFVVSNMILVWEVLLTSKLIVHTVVPTKETIVEMCLKWEWSLYRTLLFGSSLNVQICCAIDQVSASLPPTHSKDLCGIIYSVYIMYVFSRI